MNKKPMMQRLAKPMLFSAALIWGSSFLLMKNSLDSLPVQYLLAFRFTLGTALTALICWNRWKKMTRDYLRRGAIVGACLYMAYNLQTYGLELTTPSKNAFLTAVYCVLVPFLSWLVVKLKPDRYNIIAAVLCVAGVGFVSLEGDLTVNAGDALTLCGAVFFAAHIVAVAKLSPGKDIYLLTTFQCAFFALYAWIGGALTETFPTQLGGDVLLSLAYLGVMATCVALLFQNGGQVNSDPASASVILSLESVFGVIFSVIFYGDPVTAKLLLGFALIFVAVLCSETKFSFLRKKEIKS